MISIKQTQINKQSSLKDKKNNVYVCVEVNKNSKKKNNTKIKSCLDIVEMQYEKTYNLLSTERVSNISNKENKQDKMELAEEFFNKTNPEYNFLEQISFTELEIIELAEEFFNKTNPEYNICQQDDELDIIEIAENHFNQTNTEYNFLEQISFTELEIMELAEEFFNQTNPEYNLYYL